MGFLQIIAILMVAYLLYKLVQFIIRRMSAKTVDSEEFGKNLRHVQLIDLRESDEFKHAHILGARNIPYSQFSVKKGELRKDMPVYLYDTGMDISGRAARRLKKDGHKDIVILKNGFDNWEGKIKRS